MEVDSATLTMMGIEMDILMYQDDVLLVLDPADAPVAKQMVERGLARSGQRLSVKASVMFVPLWRKYGTHLVRSTPLHLCFSFMFCNEDPHACIAQLHGRCYRLLCAAMTKDPEGLSVAARWAKREGRIGHLQHTRMIKLDIAFAMGRHINSTKASRFVDELKSSLFGTPGVAACAVEATVEHFYIAGDECDDPFLGHCDWTSPSLAPPRSTRPPTSICSASLRPSSTPPLSSTSSRPQSAPTSPVCSRPSSPSSLCDVVQEVAIQTESTSENTIMLPATGTVALHKLASGSLSAELDAHASLLLLRMGELRGAFSLEPH